MWPVCYTTKRNSKCFFKKPPNWFTYKIKHDMYNQLSIWIYKYLNKLHSIYTLIPQKRIGFSNSYFIEWACSCQPIIKELLITKVVIFRNGGKIKSNEKWNLYGHPLEIGDKVVYLGVLLNFNGKYHCTQNHKQGNN